MILEAARREGIRLLTDKDAVSEAAAVFVPTSTPHLDCDCLLSWLLSVSRSYLFSHPETVLTDQQKTAFFDAVRQRRTGFPVAYITGHKEFWGLDFCVNPSVLIPKPDTELLVEQALCVIAAIAAEKTAAYEGSAAEVRQPCCIRIADICTGSGCVAVSVLHSLVNGGICMCGNGRSSVRMYVSDISHPALDTAYTNAQRLLPECTLVYASGETLPAGGSGGDIPFCSAEFVPGDLLEPFLKRYEGSSDVSPHEAFDLIVSNPPYVPAAVTNELLADGRSEPALALNGDCCGTADGTGIIQRLIPQAYRSLKSGGFLLLETGEYNAAAAAGYLAAGGFTDIVTYTDLGGMPRVTLAKKI